MACHVVSCLSDPSRRALRACSWQVADVSGVALQISGCCSTGDFVTVTSKQPPEAGQGESDGVKWAIPETPLTFERPPPTSAAENIPNPGLPRADTAPSAENPNPNTTDGQTVLEAHCSFFDADGDGVVYPRDTLVGFHKIGFNWVLSLIAACVIHLTFSYWTQTSWIPDPRLPLYIKRMHKCKHGSDSNTYDTEGRFYPEHFEEIFSKYATAKKNALTLKEISVMLAANRNIMDPVGWTAGTLEWVALWWIASDENGFLGKERVRANYDGTLWYTLARERDQKTRKKHQKTVARAEEAASGASPEKQD